MTQTQNKLSGLSSAKRAVLFDLLRKKRQAEGGTDRIEPRDDRLAPLPLSFSQLRLWFLDRLHPGDPVYNLPSATRILGSLHLPSLALALAGVADRHEALRTTFAVTEDGEPVQVIAPRFVPRLPVVDLGRDVLMLVMRESFFLVAVGIGVGLLIAFPVMTFVGSLLYGVSSADPLSFLGVVVLLTIAALTATYLPAKRATSADPMMAVRYE